jgi:hypothetical protein
MWWSIGLVLRPAAMSAGMHWCHSGQGGKSSKVKDNDRTSSPKHPPGPPITLGNMRELLVQTEFEKGNDHHGKYQQHCRFEPK